MQEKTLKRLKIIISEVSAVPVETIEGDSFFLEDLNMSNREVDDLFLRVCEEFKIKIPPEKISEIKNLNNLKEAVQFYGDEEI